MNRKDKEVSYDLLRFHTVGMTAYARGADPVETGDTPATARREFGGARYVDTRDVPQEGAYVATSPEWEIQERGDDAAREALAYWAKISGSRTGFLLESE